jgi:predicted ATPase/transcriptional regulator with XRE-family HTH domain
MFGLGSFVLDHRRCRLVGSRRDTLEQISSEARMQDCKPSDFGALLRRLRLEAGLSQEQLAERARISVQAIGAYERGKRRAPHPETLALLAAALNVPDETRGLMESLADRRRGPKIAMPRTADEAQALHNFPVHHTSFVGRVRDIADLVGMVRASRIVTLLGFGGIGKTRIALELGKRVVDSYPDGVWFVPLASVNDSELVGDAIGAAIGIQSSAPTRSLKMVLQSRHALLILDNCEHLAAAISSVAAQLLADCPNIAILATSRQPLGMEGEWLFRVEGLETPLKLPAIAPSDAAAYESVQLFAQRARSVDRRFELTDRNSDAVSAICRRLEGIPLGIELAAARTNVLSVDDLLARLRDQFKLLKRVSEEGTARHQTLRATIDWSFDLLTTDEKELFRRLAIFTAGWSLEAAEFVCGGPGSGAEVLDILSSLVNKSLVSCDTTVSPQRFGFLEATREYALERLIASGEVDDVASRRALWFASFVDEMFAKFQRMSQPQWLAQVQPEIENLRASLHWALETEDNLEIAARIAGGLNPFWQARGLGEGQRCLESILQRWPGGKDKEEALLWLALAGTTVAKRKVEAAERACNLYARLNDRAGEAESLRYLAEGLRQMQRLDQAASALERATRLFCELGLVQGPSYPYLLETRALVLANTGRYAEAIAAFDDAMRRFEAFGDEAAIAGAKCQLADVEFWMGNADRALKLGDEAIGICERLGDTVKQAAMTLNVAAYHLLNGDVDIARDTARDALELAASLGIGFYVALALQHLGTIAALKGDSHRASALITYSDRWLRSEGFEREITERRSYELGLETLRRAGTAPGSPPILGETEVLAQARQV